MGAMLAVLLQHCKSAPKAFILQTH